MVLVDGLGEDVEVWVDGEWTDFEDVVEVDVDAFDEPFIFEVDDVSFIRGAEADAEAEAKQAAERVVRDAFRNLF